MRDGGFVLGCCPWYRPAHADRVNGRWRGISSNDQASFTTFAFQSWPSEPDELPVAQQTSVTRVPELGVVTPELALVDPELAAAARQLLDVPSDGFARKPAISGPRSAIAPAESDDAARSWHALTEHLSQLRVPQSVPAVLRRAALPRADWSGRFVAIAGVGCAVLALSAFGYGVQTGSRTTGEETGQAAPQYVEPQSGSQAGLPADTVKPETEKPPPAPSPRSNPAASSRPSKPQRFAWAPSPRATGYQIELFRGPSLVFRTDTKKPEVVVPRDWTLDGRRESLVPGEYRWYVWPVVDGRRQSGAIVQARLVVPSR
jgi:hypothetical protein